MTPFSVSWDTRDPEVHFKWDGLFGLRWRRGKVFLCGIPVPFRPRVKKSRFSFRRMSLKDLFSFLRAWKLKDLEGDLSLPDPMLNGILYGWVSAIGAASGERKWDVSINFLGQNRCKGEMTISPLLFFRRLLRVMRAWKVEKKEVV